MRIKGTIVGGKQLGRTLGFPTANLRPDETVKRLPENGVYTAWITIEGYPPLGCMLNVGKHPTAPEGSLTVEAYILDFHEDVYGRSAEIETLTYLRPERKFESLEALKNQLDYDSRRTAAYFETLKENGRTEK